MSARDELEAVIWRRLLPSDRLTMSADDAVDTILAAADVYALAVANQVSDTPAAIAARREVLCQAVKEAS